MRYRNSLGMIAGTIQNLPPGLYGLPGKPSAGIVTDNAITVPIVSAPLGTAALHKADPVIPSTLTTTPLPKPSATAPMSQQYQKGVEGSCWQSP